MCLLLYLCTPKVLKTHAEVAQLVEHHLAKVRVAGSSLVFRSKEIPGLYGLEFFVCSNTTECKRPGGGIGRRAGLKILYAAMRVRVQVPPGAHRFKPLTMHFVRGLSFKGDFHLHVENIRIP